MYFVTRFRISEVAELMGVSDDTVRRWVTSGDLDASKGETGRLEIEGSKLAAWLKQNSQNQSGETPIATSARNQLTGLVTAVHSDPVMSQVELQCGRYRIVSLMSTEAVKELGLEVGTLAVAVVKATMVVIETPRHS